MEGEPRCIPFDVRIEQLEVEIARSKKRQHIGVVIRLHRRPHQVHVLARNTRSPHLQGRFERNALTEPFELTH